MSKFFSNLCIHDICLTISLLILSVQMIDMIHLTMFFSVLYNKDASSFSTIGGLYKINIHQVYLEMLAKTITFVLAFVHLNGGLKNFSRCRFHEIVLVILFIFNDPTQFQGYHLYCLWVNKVKSGCASYNNKMLCICKHIHISFPSESIIPPPAQCYVTDYTLKTEVGTGLT